MPLHFSMYQLLLDEDLASQDDLKKIFSSLPSSHKHQSYYYFIKSGRQTNNIYWLCSKFGKATPYTDDVINLEKEEIENNPRQPHQAEPNKQVFFIYDMKRNNLYCSNQKKLSFFKDYVSSQVGKTCIIKNIYNSIDEFIKYTSKLDEISFTREHNLMTLDKDAFSQSDDSFGLGKPIDATLSVRFGGVSLSKRFIKILPEWVKKRKDQEISHLICMGRDDKNVETIFNIDSLQRKIAIEIEKDSFGMYDYSSVISVAISKIF